MNLLKNILSLIWQEEEKEIPIVYSQNIINDNNSLPETKSLNNENILKETTVKQLYPSNYIKIKKYKQQRYFHQFYRLTFVQNGKTIIDEKDITDCILCEVKFGKSVNYIIKNIYDIKENGICKKFQTSFENYFLIFTKGIDVSETLKGCQIIDPYDFYTIIIHNDKVIEEKEGRNSIPLISPQNELFWDIQYPTGNSIIKIQGKDYLNIRGIFEFNKYIPECNILQDDYIYIYFHKRECLAFYMTFELCKQADSFEILQNKFNDDIDTINYCAKFSKNRVEDIAFIHYCLDKRGLGHNAYFSNLYGSKNKGFGCAGSAIYNVPYAEYLKGLNWLINYKSQFMFSEKQKNNFKELVKFIYEKYELKPDFTQLPSKFINGLILEDDFLNKLREYVMNNYYDYNVANRNINDNNIDKKIEQLKELTANLRVQNKNKEKVLKDKYQDLKQYLLKNNIYSTKWKSEMDLFKLVYSLYSDAIYQYRDSWLGLQSLDIYIPSQRLAFEYQGLQHYEPIDFWGGQEGFKRRQLLDEQKRKLCKENNVKLIEWRYDEPISKIMLDKKLENL